MVELDVDLKKLNPFISNRYHSQFSLKL